MSVERTLVIIKPDAVSRELIGDILLRFEHAGFHILAMKMVRIGKHDAELFYKEHQGKPFFDGLTDTLAGEPIIPVVLSCENAIAKARELIGATDPALAEEGTIRHDFALDKGHNSVHGSDSLASAAREIPFFFGEAEICHSREVAS